MTIKVIIKYKGDKDMTDKFIPSTQFIEKLPNICVDLELVSVYDMDCYSVPQLLYRLAQKINDTITNMEHNDEALKAHLGDLQVKLEYLLSEGLTAELQKIIEKMYADGSLQALVEGAMVDINKRLDVVEADLKEVRSVFLTDYKNSVKDNDWSYAFEEAFKLHWQNNTTTKLIVPKGEYRIARPVKLPSGGYTPLIEGEGSGTVLLADLLDNQHIFYNDTTAVVGGMTIKDLTVSVYNDNNKGGFLNLQYTTRMFNLENIRVFNLDKPIILGEKVYAICNLEKIGLYNFTGRTGTVGIYSNGNTVNILNCEVVGFKKCVVIDDVSTTFDNANVCYVKGGSYAGSTSYKIDTAFEIINGRDVKVEDVWIEAVDDSTTGAKLGKAIVIKGERAKAHFSNIHLSTSSIYVEGGIAEFNGTSFYQSGPSGFYCSEGATLIERNTYMPSNPGGQYYNNNYQNIKGNIQRELTLTDRYKTNSYNILSNNRLVQGRFNPLVLTNASQTMTVNTSDFISGSNSYTVVNTASQGVSISCNVDKEEYYTVVARVKSTNGGNIYMAGTSPTVPTDIFPNRSSKSPTWTLIYGVFKSSTNILNVRILGETAGNFNIDSISVFKGYNIASPDGAEYDDRVYLAKNRVEWLDVSNTPESEASANTRNWTRGDIIYPIYPQSGRHKGWSCVESGKPGKWIGHGVL